MPCYIIFDENLRPQGPLVRSRSPTTNAPLGFLPVYGIYKWSDDNLAEIENGIIKKADTIRIIAASIGAEPTLLEETIAVYNRYCDTGNDPEFKRPREKLVPIKGPPYYFAELCLAFINTQGGPRHNSKAQVLDWNGDPIPRLYAAGECGSMFGFLYQGGSNLAEAIVFGRIAGKNAATETL